MQGQFSADLLRHHGCVINVRSGALERDWHFSTLQIEEPHRFVLERTDKNVVAMGCRSQLDAGTKPDLLQPLSGGKAKDGRFFGRRYLDPNDAVGPEERKARPHDIFD